MSINIIKDDINELSMKSSRLIMSFLDVKSFSIKRKISNSIHYTLVNYMESKSPFIINRETRKKMRKVYFSDDITLPSSEMKSLTQEIKHEVNEDEYLEIIKYKNCYTNQDFMKGLERRKKRRHKRRMNELKIYALNIQLQMEQKGRYSITKMIRREMVDGVW